MRWLWRTDSPGDPWANMAADEALFDALRGSRDGEPAVRVYTWDRPSVSIGRLQDAEAVQREYPGLPWVRRPTGGRAVVHGDDVTISVVTRAEWLSPTDGRGVLSSYRQIVAGVIAALQGQGTPARLGQSPLLPLPAREGWPRNEAGVGPALVRARDVVDCFAAVAACDVADAATGRKLVGSAQRREGGAILQQMSVPLRHLADPARFVAALRPAFAAALGVTDWRVIDTGFPL